MRRACSYPLAIVCALLASSACDTGTPGGGEEGGAGTAGAPGGSGGAGGGGAAGSGGGGAAGSGGGGAGGQSGDGGAGGGSGGSSGTGGGAPGELVTCDAAPTGDGPCAVEAGTSGLLLVGDVLEPGRTLRGGQVLVDGAGTITCVGCDCSAQAAAATATRVTCPRAVISPGLVNAHDHLTFAQNAPYARTAERYEHRHDWRKGLRGHRKIPASGGASTDELAWGELRFVLGGATATNGSGGTRGFLRNLDGSQQEGLGQPEVHYETFPLGDTSGTLLSSSCAYPSIDTAASIARDDAYTPHVSEGIDDEARNEFLCIRAGANDLVRPQTAVIHGIALLPPDIAELAAEGAMLIWSPRSNVTLYGDTARVTEYARLGVRIALGTDWMPTGSMNVLRELRCADSLNRRHLGGFFRDEELWLMATRNAAEATATDDAIGVLAPGRKADIAIFDASARATHRAVIDAEAADVLLVLRGGQPLYGDAALVASLPGGGTCDALDVCGRAKEVCASRELGKGLAALTAANAGAYPLFFCGEPRDEPSCEPERNATSPSPTVDGSNRYSGEVSAADADGDGIGDASDNCPGVFNPIRPVDGGAQADFDLDLAGDACDPCPLEPGADRCSAPDPDDPDGDGVAVPADNCPGLPNAGQEDADADGRGDVCDACPATANPGGAACPSTIYDVKRGNVAIGSTVAVGGVVVGAGPTGFFVQVDPAGPSWAGPEHSGIFVYTGAASGVASGDGVELGSATVADFFGQIQLQDATWSRTASGVALPAPTTAAPADVATGGSRTGPLEATLVRVEDVVVTDAAPAPGPGDRLPTNEFEVTGGLRVDDFLHPASVLPAAGEAFPAINGVLGRRNDHSKLYPLAEADHVPAP